MNKTIHDVVLFLFLYLVMIVGFIFTTKGTKRIAWFQRVFGGTEKSMWFMHWSSFWGLIITSLCLIVAVLLRGK